MDKQNQKNTQKPLEMDALTEQEFLRRRNLRSVAIAWALMGMIILFYGMTFAIGPAVLRPSI